MSEKQMKRTNVYADPDDLEAIKKGAERLGVSEAELIRRGIRLAAASVRTWDAPAIRRRFRGSGKDVTTEDVRDAVAADAAPSNSETLPLLLAPTVTSAMLSPTFARVRENLDRVLRRPDFQEEEATPEKAALTLMWGNVAAVIADTELNHQVLDEQPTSRADPDIRTHQTAAADYAVYLAHRLQHARDADAARTMVVTWLAHTELPKKMTEPAWVDQFREYLTAEAEKAERGKA
ncbi:CopG family transcriptional regulator [Streptomyces sp. NPDC006450]|uniref:ribbon-helix-helix domain-containing protein n=1 Tax=Streptomyces sp. NPDC006450 TaxID=3155458 RepID=UPI0033A3E28E